MTDGFCDAQYREYGFNGFAITPGRDHFDGETAPAYPRIRKAAGESDFTRVAPQQEVVVAARDRVAAGDLPNDPVKLIRSMRKLLKTNIGPATLADYVDDAVGITRDHAYREHVAGTDPRRSRPTASAPPSNAASPPASTEPSASQTA